MGAMNLSRHGHIIRVTFTPAHLWPRRMGSGREVMDGNLQMDEGLRRSRSRGPRAKSPGAAPRRAARRLARADRPAPGASAASYFRRAPSYYRGRPSAAGPARRGPTGIGRKYGTDHIHVEQEVEDDPNEMAMTLVSQIQLKSRRVGP